MIGEISIGGVYLPVLLVMAVAALILTALLVRLMSITGAYRFIAYRPLADLCLFMLILGLIVHLSTAYGMHP